MKHRKGFTLIELLVVIAIIALLLSILMPSLQKVKKQAKSVICRSNLKQWGIAGILYTQDYAEKFWHGWGGFGIDDSNWWQGAMRPYYDNVDEIRNCPSATKPMDDINLGVDRGPGAGKWPFAAWGVTNFLGGADYGSYTANGWLEYVDDKPPAMVAALKSAGDYGKYWRKRSNITRASNVPFILDGQWIDCWPKPGEDPPEFENRRWINGGSNFTRIVQNRHNERQNVGFIDGAVRAVGLKELWKLKWHVTYNVSGIWTKAGGATPAQWESAAPWMKGLKAY